MTIEHENELRKLADTGDGEACNRLGLELLKKSPSDLSEEIAQLNTICDKIRAKANPRTNINSSYEWHQILQNRVPELQKTIEELREIHSTRLKHLSEALHYFGRSAELEDTEGIWNLAWRYFLGEGVEQNGETALRLWKKAASNGHRPSSDKLIEIRNEKYRQLECYGTGDRWAILVGVNRYDDPRIHPLHVCVDDVNKVYGLFTKYGFSEQNVRVLTDSAVEVPNRENILESLISTASIADEKDLLLFYYSGHGFEANGESYVVASNTRSVILADTAVSVSRIKEVMKNSRARAKVLILDACHSGANIGGRKSSELMTSEFIQSVFSDAEGMAIIASCQQGQESYQWPEQNSSAFTHFLIEALIGRADSDNKSFVTVQDVNRYVTHCVKKWASQRRYKQTPTCSYDGTGDIVLIEY